MKELGKSPSACGTSPSNIAGALTINADGKAKDAPAQAR